MLSFNELIGKSQVFWWSEDATISLNYLSSEETEKTDVNTNTGRWVLQPQMSLNNADMN